MKHQVDKKKLNLKYSHRIAMIRNQAIFLIERGTLTTTKPRAKEVQRFVEGLVTDARVGNTFNARRHVKAQLPYKESALVKLFKEIAPRYIDRPGGYTRIKNLGRRVGDVAPMACLEWVI